MNISEFIERAGAQALTPIDPGRQITGGYACDLLSHVMGRGVAGMAWITVQTHMNVIAVASLLEFACVIVPEGLSVEQPIIDKAADEGVALISSGKTAFELCALLHDAGVPAAKKQ